MKNWLLLLTLFSSNFIYAATLPPQGMSMAKVQQTFGAPNKKTAAIGKPPITRWIYNDFTVVFEYKHVIQSVQMVNDNAPMPQPTPVATPNSANEAAISVEVKN